MKFKILHLTKTPPLAEVLVTSDRGDTKRITVPYREEDALDSIRQHLRELKWFDIDEGLKAALSTINVGGVYEVEVPDN